MHMICLHPPLRLAFRLLLAVASLPWLAGCSSTETSNKAPIEKGLHGTIAYMIPVEASEAGTKIEVNHQAVGNAPLTIKIFGDKDGTFHNFGSDEFVVRGYPPRADQFPQTKIFKTGAFGIKDDKIPQRIYFDFSSPTPAR